MQKFAFSVGKRFIIEWRQRKPKDYEKQSRVVECVRDYSTTLKIYFGKIQNIFGLEKKYNVDYIVDCKNLRFWLECKNLRLWFLDFFMRERSLEFREWAQQ